LVGIWSWELEDIPDYFLKATQRLNQVFAVSNWSARVMSKRFGFRVDRLVSLDFRRLLENLSQDARLLDNQLVDFFSNLEIDSKKMSYIYSFFDFSSVMERKNPTAIIKIWNSIHTFFPNHFLILKCLNAEDNQKHYLQDLVSDTPRVKFLWGVLPYSLQLSLVRNAALFVSLHRSEGLGFGPLEAASFDVPVVYTNYGGFCELIPTGHFPVSWEYVLVGEGALPYPKDALWAEPNLEEAKMQVMSAIYQKLNKIWESNSSTRKNIFTKTLNDLELETINKLTSDLKD
jgi:glycosyltransferase involved in cell wall biosynthesis